MFRVVLPYAVFGGLVVDGVITAVAPIGRWMMGKRLDYVEAWVKSKQGEFTTWKP